MKRATLHLSRLTGLMAAGLCALLTAGTGASSAAQVMTLQIAPTCGTPGVAQNQTFRVKATLLGALRAQPAL